jgi:L-fuculose-phosphate aldolase/L-ribulose-5-phosphate 4-epimerase
MTRSYPIKGPPLSERTLAVKREVDKIVALFHASQSLTVVGNGNAAIRVPGEEKLILAGFEGPLKGGPAATVVVGFDHAVHEGDLHYYHEEVLHLHIAVLRERPDVNVSIHTHSPYLIGWALANRPLPLQHSAELAHLPVREIPISAPARRDDAGPVIETLRAYPAAPALLIGNHGLIAWGSDIPRTGQLIVSLEEAARFALDAEELAGQGGLTPSRPVPERRLASARG